MAVDGNGCWLEDEACSVGLEDEACSAGLEDEACSAGRTGLRGVAYVVRLAPMGLAVVAPVLPVDGIALLSTTGAGALGELAGVLAIC